MGGKGQRLRGKDITKGETDLAIVQEKDRDFKEEAEDGELGGNWLMQ
jgi:hypothetical protein